MTDTMTTVSGWTLRMVIHSPDASQDWNGSAFVSASAAAKNAGGFAPSSTAAGTTPGTTDYTFTKPAGITTAGTYPYTVYRVLGATLDVSTDTVLNPAADENTFAVTNDNSGNGTLAGEWRCAPASERQDAGILFKNASDSRRYAFNFGDIEEIVAGQTIASATVTSTEGTVSLVNVGTYRVAFTVAGGTSGVNAMVTITATLSGGAIVSRHGTLSIA